MLALTLVLSTIVKAQSNIDEAAIRTVNKAYVEAWLANDEGRVMSLFEDDGSITPSGVGYFKGKEKIRAFWFPKDSSVTRIEKFINEIVYIKHEKDVIIAASNSKITWNYRKGSTYLAKEQEGYALTFFRRQPDSTWKIWKQIWSDLWSKDR